MTKPNLQSAGIKSPKKIYHNLGYDQLYRHETDSSLSGLEKCTATTFGAVAIDTGAYTGRSPKDKYLVQEPSSENNIWWKKPNNNSDNQPITQDVWNHLKKIVLNQLDEQTLYVQDGYCGATSANRICVRVVSEIAWAAHFVKNMFIRPSAEELQNFTADWTILHACKTVNKEWKSMGLNSEVFIAFNLAEKTTLIGGTWYGGEMKKGIFSLMNYFLPLRNVGAFHCSANVNKNNEDTALFFGLSGTGKTTLSTDPKRRLIGDDEHGWDDEGVFNFEGGCYAKTINLSSEAEPDIYRAIKRNALLENVGVDDQGNVDFASKEKTENTRVSYPIDHIDNIVKPVSKGNHAKFIIFLTCDAFGVLPPVAILTKEQAMYQYLSGYTAKVAGTERGITEPVATFSPCFGGPFLTLHPICYADILGEKIQEHQTKTYLVNTGWTGGGYGVGERISLKATRTVIDAILDDSISRCSLEKMPVFGYQIPTALKNVDTELLNPSNTWSDKEAYDKTLHKLAKMFIDNFNTFTDVSKASSLVAHGPQL